MSTLLDTGILLRLVDKKDSLHGLVEDAVDTLIARREELLITTQNIAELWNVATRPITNNGLALTPTAIAKLYEDTIDPMCEVLPEPDTFVDQLKRLLIQYGATGKQVHDARLIAMMIVWQVESLLTLNERDFRRYEAEGIRIFTPASILASRP
jgi:predicted nucleic acid-binding protein